MIQTQQNYRHKLAFQDVHQIDFESLSSANVDMYRVLLRSLHEYNNDNYTNYYYFQLR